MAALPRCVSVFVDSLRLKKGRYGSRHVPANPYIKIITMPSIRIRKSIRAGCERHRMTPGHQKGHVFQYFFILIHRP